MKVKDSAILPLLPRDDSKKELDMWRTSLLEMFKELRREIISVGSQDDLHTRYSRSRATRATAQSFPTGVWTKVQYNVEDFDELNEYDHVTNFRFTTKKAGYYQVNAGLISVLTSWAANNYWHVAIFKNNTQYNYGFRPAIQVAGTFYIHSIVNDLIYLVVDDYIDIRISHNQGGNVNCINNSLYNYFSVHRFS